MIKARYGAAAALAGVAVVVTPAVASAAPAAGVRHTALAAWQGQCAKGDFCVWSGRDGTGVKCAWNGNDPDWLGGAVQCTHNGKPYPEGMPFFTASWWNNGYTGSYSRVKVYTNKDYSGSLYATIPAGSRVSMWEGAPIRSHRWVN